MEQNVTSRFQAGGTLRDGAIYVKRMADEELPEALSQGEFCYVLAPRQIGKSSLRLRAINRLKGGDKDIRCATIDLTRIGRGEHEADWYFGLIVELSRELKLTINPGEFWTRHKEMSPTHRWGLFIQEEVLKKIAAPIVIFVDEIDVVLSQPFSCDDFFASVREFANRRADDPNYSRLTFCLLGVATPGELISDPTMTPFNIGRGIHLKDFSMKEAEALLPGLQALEADPRLLLESIMEWTDGHPYMTLKICDALVRQKGAARPERERVAQIVTDIFLRRGRVEDSNLQYADRHFTKEHFKDRTSQMLQLYRLLLEGKRVPANGDDPVQMELRLTGMAAERHDEQGDCLRVRNDIFATVFNHTWIKQREADRLIAAPLARWLASDRRDDDLLRGQALEEATEWASCRNDLSPEENEFLRRGLKVANREMEERRRQDERERAAREAADEALRREMEAKGKLDTARALAQKQRAKRLKWAWATIVLAGFLITTIFLAGLAFQQRAIAQRE